MDGGPADSVSPGPGAASGHAQQPAPRPAQGTSPEELLARAQELEEPAGRELLAPESRAWAGAPALVLRRERPEVLLAEGVLASAGTGRAAAASRSDGSIVAFLPGQGPEPRILAMPEGHPAFALGLSGDGLVLAAWAQGRGEIVFFDLDNATEGVAPRTTRLTAPLRGSAALTLSGDGGILAAHDESGALWVGMRGGELRPLGVLPGRPAALGFTSGGGLLVAVDASGAGQVWNPRTGKALRRIQVPGGPFVHGDFPSGAGPHGPTLLVRLRKADGTQVLWNLLDDSTMTGQGGGDRNDPQAAPNLGGQLQQRGAALFYVAETLAWRASPNYEPLRLALSWSKTERCLRLQDLDGQVRYSSSESGAPRPQCFAVDWSPVAIRADGSAAIPGLALRVYDSIGAGQDGSPVYSRAISSRLVHLWSGSRGTGPGTVHHANSAPVAVSQSVAEGGGALAVPLRLGLADSAAPQLLRLGR